MHIVILMLLKQKPWNYCTYVLLNGKKAESFQMKM
uniref:Uncharacterized protein n=1 Tax=Anguilla anguilla TaxID=7936 RepID=A0A0E9QLF3_ANGAN